MTSTRFRALLALGMVLGVGGVTTLAAWTSSAIATSGNITTGSINLQLNSIAQPTLTKSLNFSELGKSGMIPGDSNTALIKVNNLGTGATVPLKYTITSTSSGALTTSLRMTVSSNGTVANKCTDGANVVSSLALTLTANQAIGSPDRPLAVGATENLCVSVQLPTTPTPPTNSTSNIVLTFTARCDGNGSTHEKHAKASMQNRVRKSCSAWEPSQAWYPSSFSSPVWLSVSPLIFRSGSMSPTIDTGALAFARTVPASEVLVGDIVSVSDSQGTRITHRVESIDQQGNNLAVAQLRGDANPIADPDPYVITEADRVFFSINRLGYVAVWLSDRVGLCLVRLPSAGSCTSRSVDVRLPTRRNLSGIVRTYAATPMPSRPSSPWLRSVSRWSVCPRSVVPRRGTPTQPRQQAFSSALLQPFPRRQAQPVAR
ncbi:SipW-dependent-type signal peptide-containing protein [Rhodococcus sp. 3Y1]